MAIIVNIEKPINCSVCPFTYAQVCPLTNNSVVKDVINETLSKDCPLREVEAIPKDQYEARLKADIVNFEEPTTKNDLAVEKTDMIDKSNFSQEQYKADLQSAYDCGFEAGKKAEQEPRWTPISEKFPEESGYYLVSGKDKVWICEMLNLMGTKGWSNNVSNPIVEAWMPLPQPFVPQESEET